MDKKYKIYFQPLMESVFKDFVNILECKIKKRAADELILFKDFFNLEADETFSEIISVLANLSNYNHMDVMNWLISFRQSNLNKIEELNKSKQSQTLKPNINEFYCNYYAIYECTYLVCLKEILPKFGTKLERSYVQAILITIFNMIKKSSIICLTEEEKENNEYLMNNCGFIIDYFSLKNLNDIQDIFFAQLDTCSSSLQSSSVILVMKYLKIRNYLAEHVETCFEFLMQCSNRMIKSKDKEIKHSFAIMFSEILFDFASTAKAELNILNVKKFVESLITMSLEMVKKVKIFQIAAPFITALICTSQKTVFFSNYQNIITMFFQFIKGKDLSICKTSLECIYRIIWVYFVRYKGEDNAKTAKFLNQIMNNLLFTSRNTLFIEFPYILVKIIHTISIEKQQFVITDIILELCHPPSSKHHTAEKMSVGLKAFIMILDSLSKSTVNSVMSISNEYMYQTTRCFSIKNTLKCEDNIISQEGGALILQFNEIQENVYQTLIYLDSIMCKPFMQTSPMAPQKFSIEQLSNEKRLKIILFKHCVTYISKFPINSDMIEEVSDLLTRLSLHIDEDMRMRATVILKFLIMERVNLRKRILASVIHTYLNEIPDAFPNIMENAIKTVNELIHLWRTCIPNEVNNTKKESIDDGCLDICSLCEGFGLVILCNTNKSLLLLACQTLKEVKLFLNAANQNTAKSDCSLYDQLVIILLKMFPYKEDNCFELSSIVDKIPSDVLWSHVLGEVFGRLKTSYILQQSIQFAQTECLIRFNSSHTQLESCSDTYETITSRANFSRISKKLPNYCNTSSWQCYFEIFCATVFVDDDNKIKSNEDVIESSNQSINKNISLRYSMIKQVFDKAVSLLRNDFAEMREMSADALSFTSYSLINLLLDTLSPIIKELCDIKLDLSIRKKKKRDSQIALILKIFEKISKSDNLALSIKQEDTSHLQLLLEFCELCRSTIIPSLEYEFLITDARICIVNIITELCYGIFNNKKSDIFPSCKRALFYRSFVNWLSILPDLKESIPSKEIIIIKSIFSLFYKEGVLDDESFGINMPQLFEEIDVILCKNIKEYDIIIHDTLVILLNNNTYSKFILDWLFFHFYNSTEYFSAKLFFLILDYFEGSSANEYFLIRIISLIFITSHDLDSITYLRLRKLLIFIQKVYLTNNVSCNHLSMPEEVELCNFSLLILHHIQYYFSSYYIAIVNEFFYIFQDCHSAFQIKILLCLQILFKQFVLDILSNTSCEIPNDIMINSITKSYILSPESSVMIINNLLYLTCKFSTNYSNMFKTCWINLCHEHNANFLSIFHYISAIAQHNLADLHRVIKTIIEFLFHECGSSLLFYLYWHLNASTHFKITIESSKKYPYFQLRYTHNSPAKRDLPLDTFVKRSHSLCSLFSFEESIHIISNSKNFYYPFFELIPLNSTQTIQPYNVPLLMSSYILPLGVLNIDEKLVILLHLSITGLRNLIETVSIACKKIILYVCVFILKSSQIDEKIKKTLSFDLNAAICSLQSDIIPKFGSIQQNCRDEIDESIEKCCIDVISLITSKTSRENENDYQTNTYTSSVECNEVLFIKLLNEVKHFFDLCGYSKLINDHWSTICTVFSTQSPSINVACSSLIILVELKQPLNYDKLKLLIARYCEVIQESFVEIKKYSNELLKTIFNISSRIVINIEDNESNFDQESKEMLGLAIWFFIILLDSNKEETMFSFNFLNKILLLKETILFEIFDYILIHIKSFDGLFIYIIKKFYQFSTFLNNYLTLLCKLIPLMQHKFIVLDSLLGEAITIIIITFYYCDYFSQPLSEIPELLLQIISKLTISPKYYCFGKIYELFKPINKRKDVNVFLRLICTELINISNLTIIKILINYITNIINNGDNKCQYIGIQILNIIIELIGSIFLSETEIQNILKTCTFFSKMKLFSNTCLELSKNIHNDHKFKATISCPHEAIDHTVKQAGSFVCKLCSLDNKHLFIFCELLSNAHGKNFDFSSSSIIMEINQMLGRANDLDQLNKFSIKSKKKIFPYVSDFSDDNMQSSLIVTHKPPIDEESSTNSVRMMEEIVNALNFLDEEIESDLFNSLNSKWKKITLSQTIHNKYSSSAKDLSAPDLTIQKTNSIKSVNIISLSHGALFDTLQKEPKIADSSNPSSTTSPNKSEKDEMTHILTETPDCLESSSLSPICLNTQDKIAESITSDCNLFYPSISDTLAPIYLTKLQMCMYFSDDNYLKDLWYNTCIKLLSVNSHDYNKEIITSIQNIYFLILSMSYRFVFILTELLTNLISSKLFNNTFLDEEWSKLSFNNIKALILNLAKQSAVPYLLIEGEYDFYDYFITKNGFQFLLKLSGLINDFFNIFNLIIRLNTEDSSDFNEDSFNSYFSINQVNLLSRSIYERFKKCMNNRPTIYELHSNQYFKANYTIFFLYNIINIFAMILETYKNYIKSFMEFISYLAEDLSQKCNEEFSEEITEQMFHFINIFENKSKNISEICGENTDSVPHEYMQSLFTLSSPLSTIPVQFMNESKKAGENSEIETLLKLDGHKNCKRIKKRSNSFCFEDTELKIKSNKSKSKSKRRSLSKQSSQQSVVIPAGKDDSNDNLKRFQIINFNSDINWNGFRLSVIRNVLIFSNLNVELFKNQQNCKYEGKLALIGNLKSLEDCHIGLAHHILQFLTKIHSNA